MPHPPFPREAARGPVTIDAKDARLRAMMQTYASPRHRVVGAAIRGADHRFLVAGAPPPATAVAETIFEIGSITKVFAAVLLCLLVEEDKVDPRAPLRHMADELAHVPDWITPERLVTHTSGLPDFYMPIWKAMLRAWPDGPYAGFSRSDLLVWLDGWRGRAPGLHPRHAYSNLGLGLLGEAMAMREGVPFVDLLAERVTGPLGLTDTRHHLDEERQRRFAQPRYPGGRPAPAWTFDALAAAGCLRSSAQDLARFATSVMRALDAPQTALDRAIRRSAIPVLGLGRGGSMETAAQCAGWLSMAPDADGPRFLFHNGGTAGSSCALYICPDRAEACVILSNNGIAGNLWGSIRLGRSDQVRQAQGFFGEA